MPVFHKPSEMHNPELHVTEQNDQRSHAGCKPIIILNVIDNDGSIPDTKNVFHLYHQSFKMQNKLISYINQRNMHT